MPLSKPQERQHIHNRTVTCNGYRRTDGLWDIEGHIVDRKAYSYTTDERGEITAGTPVHEMWIRLTVDDNLTVQSIEAVTDHAPFPACPHIAANYQKIVGLSIGKGWTRGIKERMGGTEGCTHLSELLAPIATTAYQTIMPIRGREERERRLAAGLPPSDGQYPLLNTCHGFRSDGATVAKYAPQFYTGNSPLPEGKATPSDPISTGG